MSLIAINKQKGEEYCYHCGKPLFSLIAINKITMKRIINRWEAGQGSLKFYCPYCRSEINLFDLHVKKVIF